ncbi:MAG TPA: trypsin-like peptidase domain-containing protein [Chloroflexota bacterium]|nr:trypsin-like peptidase domain-containing protein [Chloroflexota bacterium]
MHAEDQEVPVPLDGMPSEGFRTNGHTQPVQAWTEPTWQATVVNPPMLAGAKTQRLGPAIGAPSARGVTPRWVAGIAALCLVVGGAAGAGAGALVSHEQSGNSESASANAVSAVSRPASLESGDVSALSVDVVRRVGPAVVSILNNQQPSTSFFGTTRSTSAGSGIIIDKNGYILTNYHVIAQEQNLRVTFSNGTSTTATLVGGDPTNDIAVIKVSTPVPAVAEFGDSSQTRTGEIVIAIGNALGDLQNTVTEGVISGMGRSLPNGNDPTGNSSLQNLLQTDAAINHGNSGGPLVNLSGRVIGINTAVVRSASNDPTQAADQAQGLGFAIPSNTAKAVADRLIFKTPSPYLGVDYQPVSAQVAGLYGLPIGAIVLTVVPNSPAGKAGLRKQDVITAINGQPIDATHDLKTVLDSFHVNDTIRLSVFRGGHTLSISATLTTRPG